MGLLACAADADVEIERIRAAHGELQSQVTDSIRIDDHAGHERRRQHNAEQDCRKEFPIGSAPLKDNAKERDETAQFTPGLLSVPALSGPVKSFA